MQSPESFLHFYDFPLDPTTNGHNPLQSPLQSEPVLVPSAQTGTLQSYRLPGKGFIQLSAHPSLHSPVLASHF